MNKTRKRLRMRRWLLVSEDGKTWKPGMWKRLKDALAAMPFSLNEPNNLLPVRVEIREISGRRQMRRELGRLRKKGRGHN